MGERQGKTYFVSALLLSAGIIPIPSSQPSYFY